MYDDDPSISNKYLRWRQGKTLPHDASAALVEERSKGAVKLTYWRDLSIWELIAPEPPPISRIHRLLEQAPMHVRRILFIEGKADQDGRFYHTLPTRDQTLAIRNQYSLGAFTTLLCLARKGEVLEDDPQHFLPSACAFDIFPRILYSYRPMRYRWESLFGCLERIFWNRRYVERIRYSFSIETIRANLAALDANPATSLATASGIRCPRLNETPAQKAR